jgi:site-specific DNA-cytosine methylase
MQLTNQLEREQRQVITKRDIEKQQTWWEIQSSLCGVPNGISYELDKDRSNRIKALGNSIVPLIAREIGLAILEAEK